VVTTHPDRPFRLLASCHGYAVEADDGRVGQVETPLFPPSGDRPDYLVLRVGRPIWTRRPVVSTALVTHVDQRSRLVRVRGTCEQIAHLPEHLPLAF